MRAIEAAVVLGVRLQVLIELPDETLEHRRAARRGSARGLVVVGAALGVCCAAVAVLLLDLRAKLADIAERTKNVAEHSDTSAS